MITVLLYVSLISFAEDKSACLQMAKLYGSQLSIPQTLTKSCANILIDEQTAVTTDTSSDGLTKVVGKYNFIYLQEFDFQEDKIKFSHSNFIAGDRTGLKDIKAVELDDSLEKVYVLNHTDNKDVIYTYSTKLSGNHAPIKRLESGQIQRATNIKDYKDTLWVLSHNKNWIKVFNREADINGRRAENNIDPIKFFSAIDHTIQAPIDITFSKDSFYVLQKDNVLKFHKDSLVKSYSLNRVYDEILFDHNENKLILLSKDKSLKLSPDLR